MCFNALHKKVISVHADFKKENQKNKVFQLLSLFLSDHTYHSVNNNEPTPTESLLMLSEERNTEHK